MNNDEDNSIDKKQDRSFKSPRSKAQGGKGKKKKTKAISKLLEENQLDAKDLDMYCKNHPYNQTHIYCLACEKFICDKCELLDHKDHSKESFYLPSNFESLLSHFSSFRVKLQQQQDQTLCDFENRINELNSNISKFFLTEEQKVEKYTKDLIESILMLKEQNKELIYKYNQKFEDSLKNVLKEYYLFKDTLTLFENKVAQAKNRNLNFKERFEEFKKLKNDKEILESEYKKLISFYSFDLNCLISEFSVREFLQFIDKIKNFLDHKYMDDKTKNFKVVLDDKIKTTVYFDDSKKIFTTKNFLPKNISRVYQPIDNTNHINCFELSSTSFIKFHLTIDKAKFGGPFHFNSFCKYINFTGRLFVIGGYEEGAKVSNKCYVVEDKSLFEQDFEERKNKGKNADIGQSAMNAASMISRKFYQSVNRSFVFDNTTSNNTLRLIQISNMNYPRAGHAMVGFSPNILLTVSGVDNLTRCEVYKLDENKWEEIASLNQARIDSSVLIYNSYVYVFFGISYNKLTKRCDFLDSIERINFSCLQSSDWEFITPDMKIGERKYLPRSLCAMLPTNSPSTIYIVGGQTEKDKFSNEIFQYDLEINYITRRKDCIPKLSGFLENNFIFLYKTAVLFDLYGDICTYYLNTETFNYCFRDRILDQLDDEEDEEPVFDKINI